MENSWKFCIDNINCNCIKEFNKNKQYNCKYGILYHLIELLELHDKYNDLSIIESIFNYIELIGKCCINSSDLKKLIELLKPNRNFPYSVNLLKCLISISKSNINNLFFNDCLFELLYHNNRNFDLSIINDLKFVLNFTNQNISHVNNNKKINNNKKNYYVQHFIDFSSDHNSGIIVPEIKKWPSYTFTFHCWIRLRNDFKYIEKKRRQLYSFYTNSKQGFEAFFNADLTLLVISICTKKEFLTVQISDLGFNKHQDQLESTTATKTTLNDNMNCIINDFTNWHSITIMHIPAKNPFHSSQLCVYIDGVLKRTCDFRQLYLSEPFINVNLFGPSINSKTNSTNSNDITPPGTTTAKLVGGVLLNPFKNIFSITSSNNNTTNKNDIKYTTSVTSIPSGTQDYVWESSTTICGQMSSCFVLHEVLTEAQIKILYNLGPNQYNLNLLEISELSDLKLKFMFYYDAKCCKEDICYDLSMKNINSNFNGKRYRLNCLKDSLNAIGGIEIFFPLLNHLSHNKAYLDLYNSQNNLNNHQNSFYSINDNEMNNNNKNIIAIVLNLIRHLLKDNKVLQERLSRNNSIAILNYLIQNLPKEFIDFNLLHVLKLFVNEIKSLNDNNLLHSIYQHLLFDFRVWNKADYDIRAGHIQYILTIIKDDKEYFRKNYGVQFVLDVLRLHFNKIDTATTEENSKNLRSSLIYLIKYYIQNDLKLEEFDAIISFLLSIQNVNLQLDLINMIINLIETSLLKPDFNEQYYFIFYEQNMCEHFYAYLIQPSIDDTIKDKIFRLIKILLFKMKKISDKYKQRLRLIDGGSINGLLSKMLSNTAFFQTQSITNKLISENFIFNLVEIFLDLSLDSAIEKSAITNNYSDNSSSKKVSSLNQITNFDSLWTIMSLLTPSVLCLNNYLRHKIDVVLQIRLKLCKLLVFYIDINGASVLQSLVKSFGWQDILCQYLCYSHKNSEKIEAKSLLKQVSKQNLMTSTPQHGIDNREKRNLRDIKKFSMYSANYSIDDRLQSFDEHDELSYNQEDEEVSIKYDKTEEISKKEKKRELYSINDSNSIEQDIDLNGSNSINNHDSDVISKDLCDTIVNLLFKLAWYGLNGTSETLWKERCQIFSSLYRLNKEYNLIKPIEDVEIQLLELFIVTCNSSFSLDLKKTNSGDHQTSGSFYENSKELIKLVDYFIIKYNNSTLLSEKSISNIIVLLDKLHVYNDKFATTTTTSSVPAVAPTTINNKNLSKSQKRKSFISTGSVSVGGGGGDQVNETLINNETNGTLLNRRGSLVLAIHDEISEISYLTINILINLINFENLDTCAQICAKLNTILHGRVINTCEEASYLIGAIDGIINNCLNNGGNQSENYYAFLIPIMKCIIEKSYALLQMNFQIPNIPLTSVTPTFYEDFREYCKTDEWRIFIDKQITPLREQHLAMTINPCRMNMKIWWNTCNDLLMISIHKRNRVLGESKIKFEDTIFDSWKKREKTEATRFQIFLMKIKRNNLIIQKQLNSIFHFFISERGAWKEETKSQINLMLSNKENRYRMRCKLIENPFCDSHFEASRLRDYSGQEISRIEDTSQQQQKDLLDTSPNDSKKEDSLSLSEEYLSVSTTSQQLDLITLGNTSNTSSERRTETILEDKEKLLLSTECELVTVTRSIHGRFELTNKYIYFFDLSNSFFASQLNNNNDSSNNNSDLSINDNFSIFYTSLDSQFNIMNQSISTYPNDLNTYNDFKIPLIQLKEVQLRRYNLRASALEFFLIDQSNFFLNFNKNIRNKIYNKIVSMKLPNLQSLVGISTPEEILKASGMTNKWINREISNFDYLMVLNTIAGRSYNDLSQYPIFPWILNDYKSPVIDLSNPATFRDLSKPVGVLNPKFEDYVQQKYESFEDPTGAMKPFHYGTHYSNSANVMHYLIRLEPFTTLHIQLQSNRFDVADRQFHSLESTWQILIENPSDVKELIPEFYYLPEFLKNINKLDLGELTSNKAKVNDVVLPIWAKSAEHFIHIHRKALESDYVSEHLNEWIDLIFGYKQQGIEAEKALNVFMSCTYEGAIDVDSITDPIARRATEDMISNFGQTPSQLLKEVHPKRKTQEQALIFCETVGKPISLFTQLYNLKAYYVELSDNKTPSHVNDPIIYINIPRSNIKPFMQQGPVDNLITLSESGVLGLHGWQAYEKSVKNIFTFEKDPSLLNEKTKRSIAGPFDPNQQVNKKLFVVTHDFKLLISGGHWDNSLRVYSLSKYRTIAQIYQHHDVITCVAIDYCGTFVVTGSMDTTCMIWQIVQEDGISINLNPTPNHILYGHTESVTCIDLSVELDLVVSGSLDGTINLYNLRSGHYIKTLNVKTIKSPELKVFNIKLSDQRHILAYSYRCLDEENFISKIQGTFTLTLYSINGTEIFSETLTNPVIDMLITDQYCVLAINQLNKQSAVVHTNTNKSNKNNSEQTSYFVAASKIVFKELFELKTIQTMRLKAPIKCLYITRENSHLLVGLTDEKLIVITSEKPSKIKEKSKIVEK